MLVSISISLRNILEIDELRQVKTNHIQILIMRIPMVIIKIPSNRVAEVARS